MTEYYKYHHWNIIFNRKKDSSFDSVDHYNSSCASNKLMKYSQNRFEEKLKLEHEKLLGEYHKDLAKINAPQITPRIKLPAPDDTRPRPLDEVSLHTTGREEVVGTHFIPGLQHVPGISNSRPETIFNLKDEGLNETSSPSGKNLSLFALIEQNAAAQQEMQAKVKNSNRHDSLGIRKLLAPRFTAFEALFEKNKCESFSYLSPAQLSLKYYLNQCRPKSAPGPMERKKANCNLQRYRSKSAKMSENTSSIETASAVTVKRPSTALNSSKNCERKFKSSTISLQDELQTTEIAANALGTFLTNQNMQGTVTSEAEDALGNFSKKVDFGPDVKPPAEVQLDVEKLEGNAESNKVLHQAPKGILRQPSRFSDSKETVQSTEETQKSSTVEDEIASKAIGFSKVRYEDGKTAVFNEMGELTLVEDSAPTRTDPEATPKGKKGKGKKGKAGKQSGGKGKKGKGKNKDKDDVSDAEVEQTVRRRKKDMKFCSKLLYSIPAMPSEYILKDSGTDIHTQSSKNKLDSFFMGRKSGFHNVGSDEKMQESFSDLARRSSCSWDLSASKAGRVTFSFIDTESQGSYPKKRVASILKKQ